MREGSYLRYFALDAGSRDSYCSDVRKEMETSVYGSMRDNGLEVIRRDGCLYVRYDAGAHAAMWREDEITEEELNGIMGGRSSCARTMLAIQRRLLASGVDAYASNWKAGG